MWLGYHSEEDGRPTPVAVVAKVGRRRIELRVLHCMPMSPMWVNEDLPTSDGHPFFERLNRVLEESGFDAFVEGLCEAFARVGWAARVCGRVPVAVHGPRVCRRSAGLRGGWRIR